MGTLATGVSVANWRTRITILPPEISEGAGRPFELAPVRDLNSAISTDVGFEPLATAALVRAPLALTFE